MTSHLSRLLADRAAELGRSLRMAEAASAGLVSKTTLSQILRGERGNVTEETVKGVALAYSLPEAVVAEAAAKDRKRPRTVNYVLPDRAANLSPKAYKALLAHMDWLIEQEQAG